MKLKAKHYKTYVVLAIANVLFLVRGAEYYIAPSGTVSGPGTLAQPYALATALSGAVGRAGDTFWVRGGNYTLGHLDTKIQGAAGLPITFRQLPGERARIDGSITFWSS